jgi:hypothetical protein
MALYDVSVRFEKTSVLTNIILLNSYGEFIFIVAPCDLKIHLVSHTNKCTNYIIHYLKPV